MPRQQSSSPRKVVAVALDPDMVTPIPRCVVLALRESNVICGSFINLSVNAMLSWKNEGLQNVNFIEVVVKIC